jgi:uncharacterized membrane protein YraQ (UPF0718 family)
MTNFIHIFLHYLVEIAPALAIGFLISGFVHEVIPEDIVLKYLGNRGIRPILYSTLIGALLPVCCWGSLPIAVSFYKKGAKLGPVLAFLVATPATSISAFLVAYTVLGPFFAIYIFFAVIVMGLFIGLIGNMINVEPKNRGEEINCPHCRSDPGHAKTHKAKTFNDRAVSALKYAFFELPKEIGLELLIGLVLAAAVATFVPIGNLVKIYLGGWFGYVFSVVFGIITYLCSTASVPLIDSLIKQGMLPGAAMTLLLIGPVTSYGTILVLKKEYGLKVLVVFLAGLAAASVLLGVGFGFVRTF